ncbi:MAG: UvrD-helicase domain-containing protein [Victivallales bacterium]
MNRKKNVTAKIRNEVISASAGTGKTYQLVNRYISLLAAGMKPETLVALTFTRNAAGEIFDRIISRMSLLVREPERMKTPEYAEMGLSGMTRDDMLSLLRRVLLNMHLLQIGTLDSFFVRIIKTFSFEFGLSGDFEIIDEKMVEQAKRRVLKNILWNIEYTDKDTRASFLEEFKKATFGKEEKRLADILGDFVDSYHYKYLCAPEQEMWGIPENIWPDGSDILSTHVKPGEEVEKLRGFVEDMELSGKQREKFLEFMETAGSFRPESQFDFDNSFNKNLLAIVPDLEKGSAELTVGSKILLREAECKCLLNLARHIMKCHVGAQLHKTEGIYRLVRRYEDFYNMMIRQTGMLTFGDIPFILSPETGCGGNHYGLSSKTPSLDDRLYIDYRLDSKYDHWLIDEFQDTSYPQWKIIKNLIDEIIQDGSGSRSFFYVGDTKQAIYGWREGEASLFRAIYDEYSGIADIGLKTLSRSFRSGKEVIQTVNKVFCNLDGIEEVPDDVKKRWVWEEHSPKTRNKDGTPALDGHASLVQLNRIQEEGRAQKEDLIARKTKFIAAKIREVSPFERGLSTAVLVLQNKTGRQIAEYLQAEGIKVSIEGQFKLTDNPVVPAFLSLFKFAEHPEDNFAWQHLCMTPFAGITGAQQEVSMQVLDDIYQSGFAETIQKWSMRLEKESKIQFDEFTRRRLDQFVSAASIFDHGGEKGCIDFIEYAEAYEIPGETAEDAVQIMTVYKAKGLEYDMVFLPELKSKSIGRADMNGIKVKKRQDLSPEWLMFMPNRRIAELDPVLGELARDIDEDSCYESLCVLYVAMTRAAEALYMIADPPPKTKSESFYHQDVLMRTLSNRNDQPDADFRTAYEAGKDSWYENYPMKHIPEVIRQPLQERGVSSVLFPRASGRSPGTDPGKTDALLPEDLHDAKLSVNIKFDDVLETQTPSGSERRTVSAGGLFDKVSGDARELGTAVHELFENVGWIEDADMKGICGEWRMYSAISKKTKEAAIEIFNSSIKSQELRNSLGKPKGDSELWREKRFELILEGRWISGQFDRVTILKDSDGRITGAEILDYKTDHVNTREEMDRSLQAYAPQLELYREVLSFLLEIPQNNISTRLAFLRAGKVVGA